MKSEVQLRKLKLGLVPLNQHYLFFSSVTENAQAIVIELDRSLENCVSVYAL